MVKEKAIPQGYMTVGEVAKKMNVTVRALQYYDREGVFTPSAFSEGGRRLYNDKDIVKLHRILALKSLGFSFEEIKTQMTALDTPTEVAEALTKQSREIQRQIRALTRSLREIEALKAEVLQIQKVDFEKYADIIVNLQMNNNAYWMIKYFDEHTLDYFRGRFDRESGAAFLKTINALRDKVVRYYDEGIAPESKQGQKLAKQFWEMLAEFTGGDAEMLSQILKMGEIDAENEDWKHEQQSLKNFLGPALGKYFENLGRNPFEVKT